MSQGIDPWKDQYEKFHLPSLARRFLDSHDTSGTGAGAATKSTDDAALDTAIDASELAGVTKKAIEDDVLAVKTATFDSKFPAAFLSPDQIKMGGFLVYLAGKYTLLLSNPLKYRYCLCFLGYCDDHSELH